MFNIEKKKKKEKRIDHFVIPNIGNSKNWNYWGATREYEEKKCARLSSNPITHSSRKNLEDAVLTSPSVAPKHLFSHIEQNESPILEETNTNPNI